MFDVGFDDIAQMMERNPATVRQLASRARKRVKGAAESIETASADVDAARQRRAVQAYLAATRTGDFEALLTLLDPEVVLRTDGAVMRGTEALTLQSALTVAKAALAAATRAQYTVAALVDGAPALVMAPLGMLALVIRFEYADGLISSIDVIAEEERLRKLEIAAC
jgi:RNA polymerase sigma-70 factor (ECF subfamily)